MGHLTEDERKDAAQAQAQATGGPEVGAVYEHYKGGVYVLVACSLKEDTLEPLVTYRSNLKGTYWTRTHRNFSEMVEVHPGLFIPRFRKVER